MKSFLWVALTLFLTIPVFADCDLHRFRWSCQLPAVKKPMMNRSYTVYCNNLPVYVNREAYLEVMRYQHANVNMDLIVDDEFISGPCIPGSVASVHQSTFMRETPIGQHFIPKGLYK